MWSRRAPWAVLAAVACLAEAAPAEAHVGGLPYSYRLSFRPGDDRTILVSNLFDAALLLSFDDGDSFYYVCEDAIGYRAGLYVPVFAIDEGGAIYATSYEGLRRSDDDGCTWAPLPGALDGRFTSDVTIDRDGKVWVATSTGLAENDVFVSADGDTFTPTGIAPAEALWLSVRVAPSDPLRVYASGEITVESTRTPYLRRSPDGGQSWEELPVDAFGPDAAVTLLAVSATDPDLVFARLNELDEDAVFRSPDGGQTWTEVLRMTLAPEDSLAFAGRADGQTFFSGSATSGQRISTDGGLTWDLTPTQPQLECVAERSDGELFACGWNWDPDFFTVGRSPDGLAWEPVMRYAQITDALACPAGTIQYDVCASLKWPELKRKFGIGAADAGPVAVDAGAGPDGGGGGGGKGCGGCGLALVGLVAGWPTRRRRCGS